MCSCRPIGPSGPNPSNRACTLAVSFARAVILTLSHILQAIIEDGCSNHDVPTSHQPALYISHLSPDSTTAKFWTAKASPPPFLPGTLRRLTTSSFRTGKQRHERSRVHRPDRRSSRWWLQVGLFEIGCTYRPDSLISNPCSINFLMYTRASASDYDDWEQDGWRFDDILPLARKQETMHVKGVDSEIHGDSGPLNVRAVFVR